MSEKLCLQWSDFKENVISSFGSLREDQDFSDVTLACEDGQQIKAHRVILAGSSPFFENLLRGLKHSHPLIYMRGVKSEDLSAVVDFLYRGEANVYQDNLDSFLAIAEELKLKGLMGGKTDAEEVKDFNGSVNKKKNPVVKKEAFKPSQPYQSNFYEQRLSNEYGTAEGTVALVSQFSGDLQDLNEKSKSMMEKTSEKFQRFPLYKCKVCGKKATNGNLKKHIEAKHLEGIVLPCNNCEKTFRCRNSLRSHTQKIH